MTLFLHCFCRQLRVSCYDEMWAWLYVTSPTDGKVESIVLLLQGRNAWQQGVLTHLATKLVYTSSLKTGFWGVCGKVRWTCFSHLRFKNRFLGNSKWCRPTDAGSIRTPCCYTFLHCRSNTSCKLAVLSTFLVHLRSHKATPTFHCNRKLNCLQKQCRKGPYISEITHQKFFLKLGMF